MNKFKKGQRVFYLLMGSTCQSNIVDFYSKDGIIFYVDDLFDNIKECYLFTNRKSCIEFHQNSF
jgi:hypothetical protein